MVLACEDSGDAFDEGLDGILDVCDAMIEEAATHPLDQVRWTVPQLALLRCVDAYFQLRTGNQFGKTWAGCAEVIWRCEGKHPYKAVRVGPIEAWILCKSWSQSIAIQKKLWTLMPKDAVVPETSFSEKNGFAGVQKAVVFKNGSVIRIKTIGQDTLELESATIHYVWIDEPLGDEGTFSALQMRLRRTGGHICITQTPAITNGDLTWLRKLCESGTIRDMQFKMEAANFLPEGASLPLKTEATPEDPEGRYMDAAWCEEERAKTLAWQRGVRCDGEWEYGTTGAALEAFSRGRHVRRILPAAAIPEGVDVPANVVVLPRTVELSTGLDYGEDALRTCGVLVYVDASGLYPRLFVMSEYVPETGTTVEMDAEGLIEMLARVGDAWADLDHAWADKAYEGKTTRKNAKVLSTALARRLGLTGEIKPAIKVAKRGLQKEHKWSSVRWLHEAMIREDHFYVDEGCAWLIQALEKWDGTDKSMWKDVIDALRYALRHLWGASAGGPATGRVLQRQF
jgi:hypothetical protein